MAIMQKVQYKQSKRGSPGYSQYPGGPVYACSDVSKITFYWVISKRVLLFFEKKLFYQKKHINLFFTQFPIKFLYFLFFSTSLKTSCQKNSPLVCKYQSHMASSFTSSSENVSGVRLRLFVMGPNQGRIWKSSKEREKQLYYFIFHNFFFFGYQYKRNVNMQYKINSTESPRRQIHPSLP